MAPYLLFGFFVAGLMTLLIPPEMVETHLGGRKLWPVLKAAAFGVPLPLCSCGVIPVAASLRRHGAGRGATTAFLLSTPQTGVDSILVTWSLLGPLFAILRPIAALVLGVAGGALVSWFVPEGENASGAPSGSTPRCEGECCSATAQGNKFVRAMRYGFLNLPADIGKALVIGLLIAAAIMTFVPPNTLQPYLGRGILPMVVMMLIGIPMYVCATASIPMAAAFMAAGVSQGAALVFLMTGPASNAASIATIWKTMGRRTAILYLVTVGVGSLTFGILIDAFGPLPLVPNIAASAHEHASMFMTILNTSSAVVLLLLLGYVMIVPYFRRPHVHPERAGETMVALGVEGMTCEHCVETVRCALMTVPGVEQADISLKRGKAVAVGIEIAPEALREAVQNAGYEVRYARIETDHAAAHKEMHE
jgi:hypothetical protein